LVILVISTEEAVSCSCQPATSYKLLGTQSVSIADRPAFFAKLLPQLSLLRAGTGRPHWLVIDESHHLLPVSRDDIDQILPDNGPAIIFVTVHPEAVSPAALKSVDVVVALGDKAAEVIAEFCRIIGMESKFDPATTRSWFGDGAQEGSPNG
jgi:hypothetical protein